MLLQFPLLLLQPRRGARVREDVAVFEVFGVGALFKTLTQGVGGLFAFEVGLGGLESALGGGGGY